MICGEIETSLWISTRREVSIEILSGGDSVLVDGVLDHPSVPRVRDVGIPVGIHSREVGRKVLFVNQLPGMEPGRQECINEEQITHRNHMEAIAMPSISLLTLSGQ